MVGWPHRLNGHEFEQTLRDAEGQGSLVCCSPWGRKESDMTEQLPNTSRLQTYALVEKHWFTETKLFSVAQYC